MYKVLFICTHNSARSQMAEAYLRKLGGDDFEVESAGFAPTFINPNVVTVMAEEGLDLSGKKTQKVFDLFTQGRLFDLVITVCEDEEGKCPVFPGVTHRLHLPFPDPSTIQGSQEEKLEQIRKIRDQIKSAVQELVNWLNSEQTQSLSKKWQLLK